MQADPAILAYADRDSAEAGETLKLALSLHGLASCHCDIVRIEPRSDGGPVLSFDRHPAAPETGREMPGTARAIAQGSHVAIAEAHAISGATAMTVSLLLFPTLPTGSGQALISTLLPDASAGFLLSIEPGGAVAFSIGSAGGLREIVQSSKPLEFMKWSHIAIAVAGDGGVRLHLHETSDADAPPPATATLRGAMLRPGDGICHIAARRAGADMAAHFTGKIARPRILSVALEGDEIRALAAAEAPGDAALLADWDFAEALEGRRVADLSGRGHHGICHNLPVRGATGMDGTADAIHFHADDQGAPGWPADTIVTLPAELPSGGYAVRLRGVGAEACVPFFVRPARPARPGIMFLAPTFTYLAYANRLFAMPELEQLWGTLPCLTPGQRLAIKVGLGGSLYDPHVDGSERHLVSRFRPDPGLTPDGGLWNFELDLCLLAWLRRFAPDHGVITDTDLHRDGLDALCDSRVLVLGAHAEYVSPAMRAAIDAFLANGGRLLSPGANALYWPVDYKPSDGVMELHRGGGMLGWGSLSSGTRSTRAFTPGSWRDLGQPEHALIGTGYLTEAMVGSAAFVRTAESYGPRTAFIFEGIAAQTFGAHGPMGSAAGLEIDETDPALGTPGHAVVVAQSEPMPDAYAASLADDPRFNPADGSRPRQIRADMTFHETAVGGAVFSAGSMAWASALPTCDYCNDVSTLMTNLLRRFADPEPFAGPR